MNNGGKMLILNKKQLKKLPTHRLLTLYRRRFKEMKQMYADITDIPEDGVRYCVELDKYCDLMKSILNKRGNVK